MGYTVAAALRRLPADGKIVVAELVPAVVRWNRGLLADLAGRPLESERVEVREVDIAEILRAKQATYDAILLDVDNGPQGLTRKGNNWLYSRAGLDAGLEDASAEGCVGRMVGRSRSGLRRASARCRLRSGRGRGAVARSPQGHATDHLACRAAIVGGTSELASAATNIGDWWAGARKLAGPTLRLKPCNPDIISETDP